MPVVIKYQASLFISAQPLSTDPDSFKKALELFMPLGFYPGTVQEQAPGAAPADRLTLANSALGINVQFLSNRIDFLAMPFAQPDVNLSLAKFIDKVREVSGIISESVALRVERIGLASECMVDEIPVERLDEVRNRFIAPAVEGFVDEENIEWACRQAIRAPLSAAYNVLCNKIYNISRGTAQIGGPTGVREFQALQVALDINSHPLPGQVFGTTEADQFLDAALEAHESLRADIEKLIYGR